MGWKRELRCYDKLIIRTLCMRDQALRDEDGAASVLLAGADQRRFSFPIPIF